MKKFCAIVSAILILLLVQALLVPKYTGVTQEGALVREYYDNAGGNDVVFIGDCEVYENFSPITLWEEYGITSYIWGSPQQMIWQSYYMMEEVFRHETPKVMVFSVLAMKYDTNESTGSQTRREAYNRMALEGMRWSPSKWKAISASLTEEEKIWGGHLSYLFPLLRYHDRWSELGADDFRYLFTRPQVSDNGYLMQTGVKPMTDAHVAPPLSDYALGDNSWYYLDKMVELCRSHGTQLVLVKSSGLYPVWWWEWDEQVKAYAEENDLLYVNMLEFEEEIGIDWTMDTYDTGLHLNVWGAEKAASWFGKILREDCGVPDRRDDEGISALWAEKCQTYHQRKLELSSKGE